MKIKRISLYQSPVRLKEPFVISLGAVTAAENVIVKIETDRGLTGFGECSPFMTINGESMETCFVVAKYLGKKLVGADPLDPGKCSDVMDSVIWANSSIKSAFDIALYDIASQNAGLPLYKFLGGKNNRELVTDYTVSLGDPVKMASDAVRIRNAGFPAIKVKLGESPGKDVERIRLIRKAVGDDIPLRLDANQGWEPEGAITALKAMAEYNVEDCEEPVARWNIEGMAEVRRNSPIPIMADESCSDHRDAARLIALDACDYINIKLGKSSGIYKALKIITLAEAAGIEMQVGGFLESRLGFTASAHLALASESIIFCDFDTPLMFVEDPVTGGITYGINGRVILPEGPGLGAWFDDSYLKELVSNVIE